MVSGQGEQAARSQQVALSHTTTRLLWLSFQNSVRDLDLDLGEDRILLQNHTGLYHLDIFVPYSIIPEQSKAQFHRRTKVSEKTPPLPLCRQVVPCFAEASPSLPFPSQSAPFGGLLALWKAFFAWCLSPSYTGTGGTSLGRVFMGRGSLLKRPPLWQLLPRS